MAYIKLLNIEAVSSLDCAPFAKTWQHRAMCCFSQPVEHVSSTRIFARALDDERQALVYEMTVAARGELAMILPLPVPPRSPDDAVRFVDLEGYADLFTDLAKGFPAASYSVLAFGAPKPSRAEAPQLEVHDVGSFEASFVPTVADFARLDPRFRLPPGALDRLPIYADFGFAVFKLRTKSFWEKFFGAARTRHPHPMAFEFPRRDRSHLFFPTVHIHDGTVHPEAEFDHQLYAQLDPGAERVVAGRSWSSSTGPAATFVDVRRTSGLVHGERFCLRRTILGKQTNEDVWLSPTERHP